MHASPGPHEEPATPETLERRRQWFERYARQLDQSVVKASREGLSWACPCCCFLTLGERGGFEICPVCFWEDDGQDEHDADVVRGGPNGPLSLTAARSNYARYGACSERSKIHVRPARADECPSGELP